MYFNAISLSKWPPKLKTVIDWHRRVMQNLPDPGLLCNVANEIAENSNRVFDYTYASKPAENLISSEQSDLD